MGKLGCWAEREPGQAQTLSVMCSVATSQLSEPRFLFTGKGGPVSCTCGNWFSAAEMPPGGSVGVQQETDGTYSRIL